MTVHILHVEDNPADVELLADAFQGLGADVTLSSTPNGGDALAILARQSEHDSAPAPDLVLLDLNLPGMNGRDVLAAVKSDPKLRFLPVIVLSSSSANADVRACYELGANAFLSKPPGLEAFQQLVAAIQVFWLGCAVYPAP